MKCQGKNFTLIEMLIVIAIIGILVSLLMPVVDNIRTKASETEAKSEIQSIKTAIKSYEMTYGVLPADSENPDYSKLINSLQGDNARGIMFLDPQEGEKGTFVDPWEKNYQVYLDADYNNEVSVNSDTLFGTVFITSGNGEVKSWK